jgi:hypothetical protein
LFQELCVKSRLRGIHVHRYTGYREYWLWQVLVSFCYVLEHGKELTWIAIVNVTGIRKVAFTTIAHR